ncbi:MAG: acyltransferase family protein [Mycobacterium sp.]
MSSSTQDLDAQGSLESVSSKHRVGSLTGVRAVAAILVVATHAAYTTGWYPREYLGLVFSRMEIGVPVFFVLSGFLLFRPWVQATITGAAPPSVSRYAWRRVRRIMPAYVVTLVAAYLLYHYHQITPNPGHSVHGFLRHLTFTQLYTDHYGFTYIHQGLTQMWSLAVEASFYAVLPALAYLLLVVLCRRQWRPGLLLCWISALALISPAWIALTYSTTWLWDGSKLWLPTYLLWFLVGMALTVLQAMGIRCYAFAAIPLAVICYLIVSTPVAGDPTTSPATAMEAIIKTTFYAAIAGLMVAPLALGNLGWYAAFMASRPMVWLGEISYEIFLIHLITMELVLTQIMQVPVYTGSMTILFFGTMAVTVPLAWLLRRLTRVRS